LRWTFFFFVSLVGGGSAAARETKLVVGCLDDGLGLVVDFGVLFFFCISVIQDKRSIWSNNTKHLQKKWIPLK
jgi:hypothetical protein